MEIHNGTAYGPSATLAPLRRPRRAPYELFERGIRDFPSPGIAGSSAEVSRGGDQEAFTLARSRAARRR